VEFEPRPQTESGALGVLGKIEPFGQRRVVVTDLAEVFDQRILQCHDEIVWAGGAVVLLRVEPAYRNIGVPGEHHLALGNDCCGGARAAH